MAMTNTIDNEIIESFLRCTHKAYRKYRDETGNDRQFDLLQDEIYQLNKKRFLCTIKDNSLQAFQTINVATKSAQSGKTNYIIDPIFKVKGFSIHFDAIEVSKPDVHRRKASFVPVSISSKEKASRIDKVAFAVKAVIVSGSESMAIEYGKLLYGNTLKSTRVKVQVYSKEANRIINGLLQVVDAENPPRFFRNKHCKFCEFWESCNAALIEKDDLSLLEGISVKAILKKNNNGIFTVNQLSYTYKPRKQRKKSVTATRFEYPLKALSIREGKTHLIELPNLPHSNSEIYFDFEGLPDENLVYLIGILIKDKKAADQQISLWADSREDEARIFERFFEIIAQYPGTPLYHYGNYEIKCLKRFNRNSKNLYDYKISTTIDNSLNILSFFSTIVYPPTFSNSLKDIAAFLGFRWRNENASGVKSIYWRKKWELSHQFKYRANLIEYNMDDCIALRALKEWLSSIGAEQYNDVVNRVEDLPSGSPFSHNYSVFKSTIPEFERINDCAYFDYQRSKVYIKTNKNIQRAIRREKKLKTAPNKPNRTIEILPLRTCPHCGSHQLHKSTRESRKQVDLKLSKNGIKKWVTLYKGRRYQCCQCKRAPKPEGLKGIHRHGDKLAAWCTNQYISYRIPVSVIAKTLRESFNISIPNSSLRNMKSRLAGMYGHTHKEIVQNVLTAPFIHIDETAVSVKGFSSPYVWVFTTMESVFYLFRPNREAGFLKDMLEEFTGVLISDFFPGYESLTCPQQKCLIHLMRDLNEDLLKNQLDSEYKEVVTQFGGILNTIVETIEMYGLKKRHLNKHKKKVSRFFKRLEDKDYGSPLAEQYQNRFLRNRNRLFTFLDYDNVSWNNNNAEHAIIPSAKYRTARTVDFTEKTINEYLLLLSTQQTCAYRGIRFLDFLKSQEMSIERYSRNT